MITVGTFKAVLISDILVDPNANNVAVNSVAGAAGTVLGPNAVQCPIQHPFSRFAEGTETVDACCKCESQTKCTLVTDIDIPGINSFNLGGVDAMRYDDDVVDKCKFLNQFYFETLNLID